MALSTFNRVMRLVTGWLVVAASIQNARPQSSNGDSDSRILNFSALAFVGGGSPVPFTLGFTSATSDAQPLGHLLFLRAVGPSLAPFGVEEDLPDPTLTVFSDGQMLDGNDNYDPGIELIAAPRAGAFPLLSGGLDAALLRTFAPGSYAFEIGTNGNGSGMALGEIYDETVPQYLSPTSARLVNLSALSSIPKSGTTTIGFVLGGSAARIFLIRAMGPTLGSPPFALKTTMADPQLEVHSTINDQDAIVVSNAGWAGNQRVAYATSLAGAFSFMGPSSKDAAAVVLLPPGAYTIEISSASGGAGVVLAEVYMLPMEAVIP